MWEVSSFQASSSGRRCVNLAGGLRGLQVVGGVRYVCAPPLPPFRVRQLLLVARRWHAKERRCCAVRLEVKRRRLRLRRDGRPCVGGNRISAAFCSDTPEHLVHWQQLPLWVGRP